MPIPPPLCYGCVFSIVLFPCFLYAGENAPPVRRRAVVVGTVPSPRRGVCILGLVFARLGGRHRLERRVSHGRPDPVRGVPVCSETARPSVRVAAGRVRG